MHRKNPWMSRVGNTLRSQLFGVGIALLVLGVGCQPDASQADGPGEHVDTTTKNYRFELPSGVPAPRVPAENPMSEAKVALGRHLFYDVRLSGNQTQSCGSCHIQELAFTDGRTLALGSTGEAHFRHSMSLVNVAYSATLGWADPATTRLEQQAAIPMFGESPVELGLSSLSEEELLARFAQDPVLTPLFEAAFPDVAPADRVSVQHIIQAIASFERSLLSFDSPFDRYIYGGDEAALSAQAQRGMALFFSERLECFHCHGGFNFSDSVDHDGLVFEQQGFHNTGLYNVDAEGGYPAHDRGLYDMTGEPRDMGRFRAPTLRNIAVTAPYFHDGSAGTLEEVIAHYERGGRAITSGPHLGDGSRSPLKSELIVGFILTDEERADLVAFLEGLTDETFLQDPAHSDPWEAR